MGDVVAQSNLCMCLPDNKPMSFYRIREYVEVACSLVFGGFLACHSSAKRLRFCRIV